jgi:hypothetical protein
MSENAEPELPPEMWVTDIVGDGRETGAVVSHTRIKARDLTEEYVGKFLGCYDPDIAANCSARILEIKHFDDGNAPGVSVWFRHSALPDGRPARDERTHVPFDYEFELVEMMAW